ncbi:hypothetical protein ABZ234_03640 [Nocardiopsis sp. NPDC006198]|uniref:hypothetical protein n=1 Tax=Nocardiopsis sp. NPDC006198 TaxID=3154472 RepID=UPI0033BC6212
MTVTLANGTTITGTLCPDRTEYVHVIDIGGAEVMVRPDQATIKEVTAPQANGRRHVFADHQDKITDEDWATTRAVHEAAHAVIGMIVGLTLKEVWVETGRRATVGGEARFEPGVPQALAVHLMAGPMAQAKAVAERGYDPLVQASVESLAGQGDHATINTRLAEGHVIWLSQAQRDAQALLDSPEVWQAICSASRALANKERLSGADVRALIGEPRDLTCHRAWLPGLT